LNLIRGTLPILQNYFYPPDGLYRQIIGWVVNDGVRIADLKRSRWSGMLKRPGLKAALARAPDGELKTIHTALDWARRKDFVITLGQWGGEHSLQMSRRGHNLVVQLNFTKSHEAEVARLSKRARQVFEIPAHPIAQRRITLAWARVDLNLDDGQALIEEIQNDWLRKVRQWASWFNRWGMEGCGQALLRRRFGEPLPTAQDVARYARALQPYEKIWAEATLAATLKVLVEQVGIRDVFMHTPESGARLKRIHGTLPPRSLYSTLPKKAGFKRGRTVPGFLEGRLADLSKGRRRKKKPKKIIPVISEMWRLNLDDQDNMQ
jgi:hypothetical protein